MIHGHLLVAGTLKYCFQDTTSRIGRHDSFPFLDKLGQKSKKNVDIPINQSRVLGCGKYWTVNDCFQSNHQAPSACPTPALAASPLSSWEQQQRQRSEPRVPSAAVPQNALGGKEYGVFLSIFGAKVSCLLIILQIRK